MPADPVRCSPTMAACLLLAALSAAQGARAADRFAEPHWARESAITVAVTAKLAAERFSSMTHLRVETDRGGVVSLSGTAGSRREAMRAASIARRIEGVLRVESHIVVDARAVPATTLARDH